MTIDNDTRQVIYASVDAMLKDADIALKDMESTLAFEKAHVADLEDDVRKQRARVDSLLKARQALELAFEWMEREENDYGQKREF